MSCFVGVRYPSPFWRWVWVVAFTLVLVGSPASVAESSPRLCLLKSREAPFYTEAQKGFVEGLARLGYPVGQRVELEVFVLTGTKHDSAVLSTLMRRQPDLIVALGTDAALALKNLYQELEVERPTPIVFALVPDPLGLGIVESLERSGRPFAGGSLMVPPAKQFRLLRDLLPKARRLGVFYNQGNPLSTRLVEAARSEATGLGWELHAVPVRSSSEVAQQLNTLKGQVDALWVIPDAVSASGEGLQAMLAFAQREQVPIMGFSSTLVRQGALVALEVNFTDQGAQTAELAVRILEGAQPAELPVSPPRRLVLSLNLKTVRQMNLQIPEALLNLADEVIDQ